MEQVAPTRDTFNARLSVLALTAASFIALYYLRALDDNRLVSWAWVFGALDPAAVLVPMLVALCIAMYLSRFHLPGPRGVFAAAFITSAAFWGQPEVIVDASRYFTQAKHLSTYGISSFISEWGRALEAWTDMPLIPFIYGIGFKLLGESRMVVQLINSAMFAGAASLTVLIGRRLFDDERGRASGLLLIAVPYLFTQSPLMMVDVGCMFLLTLAMHAYMSALDKGRMSYCILAGLALWAAFLSKYSEWIMLTVLIPVFFIYARRGPGPAIRRTLIVLAAFGVLSAITYIAFSGVIRSQMELLIEYQRPGLGRWGESLVSTFLFHVHPIVTIAALASICLAISRRDTNYIAAAWVMALIIVVLQVKRIRYTLPAFPMLCLMAGYGLSLIRSAEIRRMLILSACAASFCIAALGYMPFLKTDPLANLKSAAEVMDSMEGDSVRLITEAQDSIINPAVTVPIIDLYTSKRISYKYDMKPQRSDAEIAVSPLRFTWQYINPYYYQQGDADVSALVYISPRRGPEIGQALHNYYLSSVFDIDNGLYQFRPYVSVFVNYIDKYQGM